MCETSCRPHPQAFLLYEHRKAFPLGDQEASGSDKPHLPHGRCPQPVSVPGDNHPLSLPGSVVKVNVLFSLCFFSISCCQAVACVVSDSDRSSWLLLGRGLWERVPLVPVLSVGSQAVDSEEGLALWVLVGYPSVIQERIHQEGDRGFWKVLLSNWGSWCDLSVLLSCS